MPTLEQPSYLTCKKQADIVMIHQFVIPEPKWTLGMADFHKTGDHKTMGIF
jgi:hypothetical protein